jgi:ectoine hydroxylase-related dioxygenase (phytanoyl-CoA dioxygenase family)
MIPAEKVEQYHEEGYMILEGIIPEQMLSMLREECAYFMGYMDAEMDARKEEQDGINKRRSRYFIANRYHTSPRLWKFIYSDLMARVAQAALGPEVYLFHEQWVIKAAERGGAFSWHQDSGYVKHGYKQTTHRPYLTCWCPLDDVNEENGSVYVLPHARGGTRAQLIEHTQDEKTNDLVGYHGDDPGIPVVAPAGSVVAFTSYTFHRSGRNRTPHHRRVFLPQYSAEPILNEAGDLWAQAVPFVKNGVNVYDHEADMASRGMPV